MDAFLSFIAEWWKSLTAGGIISAVLGFGWKHRTTIRGYAVFFRTIKKRFEKVENIVLNPISPDARFCPNCDTRMNVEHARLETYWYRCLKCDKAFPYPSPIAASKRE